MLKRNIKTIYNFANASLVFWVIMNALTSVFYHWFNIDRTQNLWMFVDLFLNITIWLGVASFLFIIGEIVKDYVDSKSEEDSGYKQSAIGFTHIERDSEGEEVKRETHEISLYHNMPSDVLKKTLHAWHRSYEKVENPDLSSKAFCEFVEENTKYTAAPTEDEFVEKLIKKL